MKEVHYFIIYVLSASLFYSASKKYKAEAALPLEDSEGEIAFSDVNDDEQASMEEVRVGMSKTK